MKWLRWEDGRQGGGYRKLLLGLLPFADSYLLHMPEGSALGPHKDPVEGKEHHRVNVILKRASKGGVFRTRHEEGWRDIPSNKRIVRFRPDSIEHEVTQVTKGGRWVLSFGWVQEKT